MQRSIVRLNFMQHTPMISSESYYTLMLQHSTYLICEILFINFYGSLLYQKNIKRGS